MAFVIAARALDGDYGTHYYNTTDFEDYNITANDEYDSTDYDVYANGKALNGANDTEDDGHAVGHVGMQCRIYIHTYILQYCVIVQKPIVHLTKCFLIRL